MVRDILATNYADDFAETFAENLAEYALGRPIGFTDGDLIESVTQQAEAGDFAIREFVIALVLSETFREKR